MVLIDGKNKNYERCKMSVRSALRELHHAKKELTQAYESEADDFDGIIEDLELKLKWLEQRELEEIEANA